MSLRRAADRRAPAEAVELLVDTSVWVDHLRKGDPLLAEALVDHRVAMHPHILGEIALGALKNRRTVLSLLENLPQASSATDREVQTFVERRGLFGRGIGYVDAHLLAATSLAPGRAIWTRDKRLMGVASDLNLLADVR